MVRKERSKKKDRRVEKKIALGGCPRIWAVSHSFAVGSEFSDSLLYSIFVGLTLIPACDNKKIFDGYFNQGKRGLAPLSFWMGTCIACQEVI